MDTVSYNLENAHSCSLCQLASTECKGDLLSITLKGFISTEPSAFVPLDTPTWRICVKACGDCINTMVQYELGTVTADADEYYWHGYIMGSIREGPWDSMDEISEWVCKHRGLIPFDIYDDIPSVRAGTCAGTGASWVINGRDEESDRHEQGYFFGPEAAANWRPDRYDCARCGEGKKGAPPEDLAGASACTNCGHAFFT